MHFRGNRAGRRHSHRVHCLTEENEAMHAQVRKSEETVLSLRMDRNYWRLCAEDLDQLYRVLWNHCNGLFCIIVYLFIIDVEDEMSGTTKGMMIVEALCDSACIK